MFIYFPSIFIYFHVHDIQKKGAGVIPSPSNLTIPPLFFHEWICSSGAHLAKLDGRFGPSPPIQLHSRRSLLHRRVW